MNKKISAEKDVLRMCLEAVKGYERRRRDYILKRNDIIYSGSGGFVKIPNTAKVMSPTEFKTERLERLENNANTRFMRVVEEALENTGADVLNPDSRRRLKQAIKLNCENGRDYTYEKLNIDEFSRRDFYRRRKRFLTEIAFRLGLLEERKNA